LYDLDRYDFNSTKDERDAVRTQNRLAYKFHSQIYYIYIFVHDQ
jgi:hypothetical protein